jgi:hypothetical protein
MKELESGWTVGNGDIYHFKHVDKEWAFGELESRDDQLWAIEVIHSTLADDGKSVHQNTFLVWGYTNALAKAAQIQAAPYPDEVLEIRPATDEEIDKWHVLFDFYERAIFPPALSEEQVEELGK